MSSYNIGGRIIIDSNSRVPHSHRPVGALYYDVIDNYLYVVSTYGARSEWVDSSSLSPGKFKKHKCLHSDCPGMCEKCLDQFEEIDLEKCPACDKEQTIECPICAVTKCSKDFMKSKHCSHGICHKCFADSFRAERPINKCPLCRATYT